MKFSVKSARLYTEFCLVYLNIKVKRILMNFIIYLPFFDFSLNIVAHSKYAELCLNNLCSFFPIEIKKNNDFAMKPNTWIFHVFSEDDEHNISDKAYSSKLIAGLHKKLASLRKTMSSNSLFVFQAGSAPKPEYIHVIQPEYTPDEISSILGTHIYQILRRWLLANKNILIHSSGVIHRRKAFLFLGRSGSGKTTITELCYPGAKIIHDDMVFLHADNNRFFLFASPEINNVVSKRDEQSVLASDLFKYGDELLSGMFVIKQSRVNSLRPLSSLESAYALISAFLEFPRMHDYVPTSAEMKYAMSTLADAARSIPAYELHFRKSPDFWQLIDEQFPD